MISFLSRGAAFKPYDATTSLHSSQLEVSTSGPVYSDSGAVWCETSRKSVEAYQMCLHKETSYYSLKSKLWWWWCHSPSCLPLCGFHEQDIKTQPRLESCPVWGRKVTSLLFTNGVVLFVPSKLDL